MGVFLDTVKLNQQFYKFMETIYDFIFKITSRLPAAREWFRTHKLKWSFLNEWNENCRFPVNPMDPSNNVRLYKKRGNMQLHAQYLKSEAYKNHAVREARLKRLEMLKQNTQPDLSQEPDFDLVDLQDYKFTIGE